MVVGGIWEIVAWAGVFPRRLFPTLEEVALSFFQLTVSGILPHHAIETVIRLLSGFTLAAVFGVTIGVLMGRSRRAEDIFLPLVSICAPIPGLAYAPLFLLWFGLGNFSAVLLVGFVSAFPVIFNSWTGVKAVKEIWVRSAQSMGADDRRLFRHVILPGALPYILTGLRLGLAQAWRILVGGRDARRRAVGPRLDDLRRARVPQHRRHDGRHRCDRHHRSRAGETRVPEDRELHRRALGNDHLMTENGQTIRSIVRAAITLAAAAVVYETLARSGYFAPALLPTLSGHRASSCTPALPTAP